MEKVAFQCEISPNRVSFRGSPSPSFLCSPSTPEQNDLDRRLEFFKSEDSTPDLAFDKKTCVDATLSQFSAARRSPKWVNSLVRRSSSNPCLSDLTGISRDPSALNKGESIRIRIKSSECLFASGSISEEKEGEYTPIDRVRICAESEEQGSDSYSLG